MSRKTRKLIWSVPLIAAVAVIGALAAFMTMSPGELFADELADAPQNLVVEPASGSAGRFALVLDWDAPASGAPDMYRVDVSSDNSKYKFQSYVPGTQTTYTHMNIRKPTVDPEGVTRFYRVFAVDSVHGSGAVSTAESNTTDDLTVPGQTKPFRWSSSDPEMVDLTWTAPDDGGAPILGYCIRAWPTGTDAEDTPETLAPLSDATCLNLFESDGAGKPSLPYRNPGPPIENDRVGGVIRILPATSYTHKGLRAKQEWTYVVHAVNRYGHSETPSDLREAQTDPAEKPGAPGSLLALQDTGDALRIIKLYWTAADDGGQDITGYQVEISNRSRHWPTDSFTVPQGIDTKDPPDDALELDGEAFVQMFVLNADSQTDPDEIVKSHQFQHLYTTGSNLDEDDTTIALEFADKLYYQVKTITGTGNARMESTYIGTDIDLETPPDTGNFEPKVGTTVVTPDGGVEDGEAGGDGDGDEADDDDDTPAVVKLTITQPSTRTGFTGVPNSYRVDVSTDSGETWETARTVTLPIDEDEYEHEGTGVKAGKGYHFRLFGKAGSTFGPGSLPVEDWAGHSTAPGKVQSLEALKDGAGSIKLSWTTPEDNGGAMIDKYCIVANEMDDEGNLLGDFDRTSIDVDPTDEPPLTDDDSTEAPNCTRFGHTSNLPISLSGNEEGVFNVSASTTSVTFTGILQETRWRFWVYALNGATGPTDAAGASIAVETRREGLAENSDQADDKTGEATTADAPPYLTAESAKDTNLDVPTKQGVLVLWTSPANPAGAPVLSYKVERKIGDGEFVVQENNVVAGQTYWPDGDEPAPGQVTVYRVTSNNEVDEGGSTTVTVPLAEHMNPPGTVGDASGLTTAPGTAAGTAVLTWTEGDNANIHWLLGIAVNADGSFDYSDPNRKWMQVDSGSPYTVTGLTPGKMYAFAIISGYYAADQTPDTRWSEWTWGAADVTVN